MKKKSFFPPARRRMLKKLLVIMKLVCLFMLITRLAFAEVLLGQEKHSFVLNKVTLEEAINRILDKTGYYVVYTLNDIRKVEGVTLNMKDITVEEALKCLLADNGLKYEISENTVVISKAEKHMSSHLDQFLIQGIVRDEKGQPLPGASVYLKLEKFLGITTDIEGKFVLKIPSDLKGKVHLIVSFVGMKTVELPIDGRAFYEVKLFSDVTSLQDVVITGYQTISRERATGSFNVLRQQQLDRPTSDLSSRLIGTVAGVQATLTEDGKASLEIRGRSTLNANTTPLIVVDGFPVEGGFDAINPNDVESVSILKDAAAASIWGARSANGVIVIATKKAQKGSSLIVNFNVFIKVRQKMDLGYANPTAKSADQIRYEEIIYGHYGCVPSSGEFDMDNVENRTYTKAQLIMNEAMLGYLTPEEKERKLEELKYINYEDDVYRYLLRNPFLQQYNLAVSGGGERTNFMTSLMYEKDKTHYIGTQNEKYMLNMKMNSDIFKWLKFDISAMIQYKKDQNNGVTLEDISEMSPYERLVNPDGSYAAVIKDYYQAAVDRLPLNKFPYPDWYYNPLEEMRNRDITTKALNTRIQAGFTFRLWEGLTYSPMFQYEIFNTKDRKLYNEKTYFVKNQVNYHTEYDPETGIVGRPAYPTGDILDQVSSEIQGYTFRNQVNFSRTFGQHEANVVLGTEIRHRRRTSYISPRVYGYNDETLTSKPFPYGVGGSGADVLKNVFGYTFKITDYTSTFTDNTDRFFSLYGNAAYTFKGRYTLSGSVRTDASNFISDDPAYRYAPFWSVGAMWNIGRENFMKPYSFIDRLLLRITYGYNGNVDTSTSFKPLINMASVANVYKKELTATIASFGNPTLRWEKVGSVDIGIDFSLWESKLFGKLDFYRKYSRDLIAKVSIPAANGTTSQKLNNAELVNRGIEIELGSNLNIYGENIQWYGNLNYAYNFNRIEKLFQTNNTAVTYMRGDLKEGYNTSTIYAWHYAGVNKEGIPCVEGVGEGVLTPMNTLYNNSVDGGKWLRSQGLGVAPHTMGLTTGFKIYDLDISLIITGKFGHVFKRSSFNYPAMGSYTYKIWVHKDVTRVLEGDPALPPLPSNQEDNRLFYYDSYYTGCIDYLYENASHIRFQELNLTYHIPTVILQKIGIKGVAVYGQINNLGLIAANKWKIDPEFPEGTVKPERTFIFGLKFNF